MYSKYMIKIVEDLKYNGYTSVRLCSSRRKSKSFFGSTGSQNEVAALSTMPAGLPGSSTLFLVMTLTSSPLAPDKEVQLEQLKHTHHCRNL